MESSPHLSICIPAYNMEAWIAGAIDSAIAVAPADAVEIVVIDNASTDNTAGLLTAYADCRNVRVVRETAHVGMVENFNRAARHARGRWITVLAADDELLPTYFEHLAHHVHRTDVAALSQVALIQWADKESPFGSCEPRSIELDDLVASLGGAICISSTAFRRDLFEQVGGFDPEAGPIFDFDFFYRLATLGLPIEELGVAGGRYFPLRGSSWQRLDAVGEANRITLRWIRLRRSLLGPDRAAEAERELATRARAAGRARLVAKSYDAAVLELTTAAQCARGLPRLSNRCAVTATRVAPGVVRQAVVAKGRVRQAVRSRWPGRSR
jgi:glycosyltransferase involved in cell wall biosynthesis